MDAITILSVAVVIVSILSVLQALRTGSLMKELDELRVDVDGLLDVWKTSAKIAPEGKTMWD